MLQTVELGSLKECADIAFDCASNTQLKLGERLGGVDALIALDDLRLPTVVDQIAEISGDWPEDHILSLTNKLAHLNNEIRISLIV